MQRLSDAIRQACDLLAERSYGSPARSPAHNARLVLEAALAHATPTAQEAVPVAWKTVDGHENYEVSDQGDLRSKATGRVLAKSLAGSGYVKAEMWKDGVRHQTYIHRLVAKAFLDGEGDEVNHKNGIKTDNRAENLEWCSRSENTNHAYYELGHLIQPVTAKNPDTGEIREYRSIEDCVRDGFDSAHVYRAIRQPHRKVKGFHISKISAHPPQPSETVAVAEALAERGSRLIANLREGEFVSATREQEWLEALAALRALKGESDG